MGNISLKAGSTIQAIKADMGKWAGLRGGRWLADALGGWGALGSTPSCAGGQFWEACPWRPKESKILEVLGPGGWKVHPL